MKWLTGTVDVADERLWDRIGGYFNLVSPKGMLLDLSKQQYVPWSAPFHAMFSDFSLDNNTVGIARESFFQAVVKYVWSIDGATERVLNTITQLICDKASFRGEYWVRVLETLARNIKFETPPDLLKALLNPRIPPEYKNLITVWKIHLANVYAGQYDALLLFLKFFLDTTLILSTDNIELISSLRHYNSIPYTKKLLKEKKFFDKSFIRLSFTNTLTKTESCKIVYGDAVYQEALVDRLSWGAALWWYRKKNTHMVETSSLWTRYCKWMVSTDFELPDE